MGREMESVRKERDDYKAQLLQQQNRGFTDIPRNSNAFPFPPYAYDNTTSPSSMTNSLASSSASAQEMMDPPPSAAVNTFVGSTGCMAMGCLECTANRFVPFTSPITDQQMMVAHGHRYARN